MVKGFSDNKVEEDNQIKDPIKQKRGLAAFLKGKKVSILGFGSFEPRDRSARQGLNPKTGEKIAIPAKRVPTFSAGKLFKDRVQG